MEHSYLIKNASTHLSQKIEVAALNDPKIKYLWNYVRLRQPSFLSRMGFEESDIETIKCLLQSFMYSYELALVLYKLHPHGNRQRNRFKAQRLIRAKSRRNRIDYTLPDL